MIHIKRNKDIIKMRKAGLLTRDTLNVVGEHVRPGITTLELDAIAEDYIRSHGGVPNFKNYHGFPATACISVNDVVVHGIPSSLVLKEGDIVSVDMGAIVEGFHGDAARTFPVGQISAERQRLIDVAKQSFFEGLKCARDDRRLGDLSHAVGSYVESNGFSVVKAMVGHGIGKALHEDPSVPNYGTAGTGIMLKNGMTIAVEPMINAGTFDIKFDSDGWTCRTKDGSDSAHYENTILITFDEPEILTL